MTTARHAASIFFWLLLVAKTTYKKLPVPVRTETRISDTSNVDISNWLSLMRRC